jgi:hypothetical protein
MPDRYSVVSKDGQLTAEFQWNGDRFSHELSVDGAVVSQSVEGDSQCDWPSSPPIQQLSQEKINGQMMVLGVGGAGRSHWSISAGPCSEDAGAIRFDLACRFKETPKVLGSFYKIDSSLAIQIISGQSTQEDGNEGVVADPSQGPTAQWSYRLRRRT